MEEQEAAVEHLRDFMRSSYLTGNQVARRIGVRDTTIYSWLQGKSTPRSATAARITAFLDSLPAERAGIMPTGYEYREYKNWRGIPKPEALSVLQAGERGDTTGPNRVSRSLSELRSDGVEKGGL